MKFKHITLLVLSAAGFCASCANNSAQQKFLNEVNNVVAQNKEGINTCYDAVNIAKEAGYDLEGYQLSNKDECFAFDLTNKTFVVMNGDRVVNAPHRYRKNKNSYAYFKFTDAYDATSVYSQYLTKDFKGADMLVVTTGLDMGENKNVKNVIYNNTSLIEKNIVLNTFCDYLTITAPTDNITHYGDANNVFITAMNEDKEFHAHGVYAYLQPAAGNIYLEADSSTDLFELKEGSTAKVVEARSETPVVIAAINAPDIATQIDINYVDVTEYSQITEDTPKKNTTTFFRLAKDITATEAWEVQNDFFLDLNGKKISFTGDETSPYFRDGDNYYPGILLDVTDDDKGVDKDLECYIIDTQPTLYERPSIELNDCSIIVAGSDKHSARLNITSGRIHDIRGVISDQSSVINKPAVLVIGNTENNNPDRKEYDSSFYMYGGYIKNSEGPEFKCDPETGVNASFKCIQPRGEGALIDMSYGDLYSRCYCISGQGSPTFDKYGGTTVNISGGTIVGGLGKYEGDIYTPLFFPQGGELNITGGNVTGPTCLNAKSGNINITGGDFTATKEFEEIYSDHNGSHADGSVFFLESNAFYAGGDINLVVNGATMTSNHAYITNAVHNKESGTYGGYKQIKAAHNGGTYYYAKEGSNKGTHIDAQIANITTIEINGGTWIPSNQ